MKKMRVKKLKRICSVRGCRSMDTYAISLSSEGGNSVIICKSCVEKANNAISDFIANKPQEKTEIPKPPALFFNGVIETVEESDVVAEGPVTNDEIETEEPIEEVVAEETDIEEHEQKYVCPHCGKEYKTEEGLERHIESKHKELM